MPHAFKQRPDEPVIFPPAFDKFYSGELQPMLQQRGIRTVICCGASNNQAVIYTATGAVRPFGYNCVIPVDGLIARGDYEHEFTLHQCTILPGDGAEKFRITEFDKIKIAGSVRSLKRNRFSACRYSSRRKAGLTRKLRRRPRTQRVADRRERLVAH